jgi:hypothetical protein
VFIAARIAVDFIAFGESPTSQVQKLRDASHISGLDVVYRLVLDPVARNSSVWDIFQPILGTADRFEDLLNLLRAVIHVREGDEIFPIHESLPETIAPIAASLLTPLTNMA